ncbi:hypothetical protein J1614_007032 [Plenodomus biglobosus]|nr:hypothetical protein J1614_007032 [Plenodomus biglobosus]
MVIGRISSNKGLHSRTEKDGRKAQIDQEGNLSKRRQDGIILGQRLRANAPKPAVWDVLESTFHKQLSNYDLEWRKDKSRQAKMVTDIKEFLKKIPKGSEVTVCIRYLDSLVVHVDSFLQFVRYVVSDCGLNALFVFQEDPSGEIAELIQCLRFMADQKRISNLGLQNRNTLPKEDMWGAREVPIKGSFKGKY